MLIDSKTQKPIKLTRKRYLPLDERSMMPHISSTIVIRRGKKFIDLKKVREAGATAGKHLREVFKNKTHST